MKCCGCLGAADVDVLRVDAVTPVSNREEGSAGGSSVGTSPQLRENIQGGKRRRTNKGKHENTPPTGDDLRNYAYEGEGSSPGSLSSCECSAKERWRVTFENIWFTKFISYLYAIELHAECSVMINVLFLTILNVTWYIFYFFFFYKVNWMSIYRWKKLKVRRVCHHSLTVCDGMKLFKWVMKLSRFKVLQFKSPWRGMAVRSSGQSTRGEAFPPGMPS